MHTKKLIATLLILIPILLAACSPALESNSLAPGEPDAFFPAPALEESALGGEVSRGAFDQVANQPLEAVERLVIKDANMTIVIPDPGASLTAISQMAEAMGGFVVSSNLYTTTLDSGEEVPRGVITIRVPSERFNEAIGQIESVATEVRSKNESGQDVTQEYTDLQSTLRNLEAAEAQLIVIMEDANRTEDVINVFNQLTQVRGQIEVTKGRMQYLEQSAALSAITVDLVADAAVQPLTIGGWQPGGVAKSAIQALINALKVLADLAIWIVLFVLPVLLVLAIPFVFVIWIVRSRRRSKSKEQAVENPESK